jgi:hypothetical protein
MLGQYGQGGKAAIGHLGRRFTVEASRPDDDRAWKIADDEQRVNEVVLAAASLRERRRKSRRHGRQLDLLKSP